MRPFPVLFHAAILELDALQLFTAETKIQYVIKMILLNYNRDETCSDISV
jgi:hypothetical protein